MSIRYEEKDLIARAVVEKPFLQRRFIQMMKEKLGDIYHELESHQVKAIDALEDLTGMFNVLIEDDTVQMSKELPEAYYAMIGSVGVVGVTTDPDDLWEEEPHYQMVEITKEQFEVFCDE